MRQRIDKFFNTPARYFTNCPGLFSLATGLDRPLLPRQTARRNRFLFFLSEINHLFVRRIALWLFFRQ